MAAMLTGVKSKKCILLFTGIKGIMLVAYIVVPTVMVLAWIISIAFMVQTTRGRNAKSA